MNSGQKNSVLFGLFAVFFMILLPPWKHASYGLIFDPPSGASEIDFARLAIQVLLASIFSGALFLISKPTVGDKGSKDVSTETVETRKLTIVLVCGVFVIAITGVFCAHIYNKQQDVEQAQIAESAALARINHQRAAVAVVANDLANKKKEAEERERLELKRLASPKTWRVKGQNMQSVTLSLVTYWKADQLYYKLVLRGQPDALEYASDSHPVFQLSLLNSDQVSLGTIQVPMTELQSMKGRNGAMIGLSSSNCTAAFTKENYEAVVFVGLDK